ncbi:MAG: amino acid--tRNA ligase-related protein, partial [Thermodesulfobacteriota bacterium]
MSGGHDNAETWRRLADGRLSWDGLRARAEILHGIRSFFRRRGFLEVDPPIASPCPNIDPNIYPVRIEDAAGKAARFYLHTSPELAMKKLLAAGSGNIFFLGKVFRDREGSPLHSPEFTMLEWYRLGNVEAVMNDVEELVRELASGICGGKALRRGGREIPIDRPWDRRELSEAFRELLGAEMTDGEGLRAALSRRGFRPGADESAEELFFRACIEAIEPDAAKRGACFLTGFPAALGAMARRRTEDPSIAER